MPLNVVHIIDGLGIGGAERHLVNIVNAMNEDERAVVCIGRKPRGASFHQSLAPAVTQAFIRIRSYDWPVSVLKLASFLRRNRTDVVHTHMYRANLYGCLAAKLAKVPVIVTSEHGENPWKSFSHRWLERNIISNIADVRLCVSKKILDKRRNIDGVPIEKLRLTVNGTVLPKLGPGTVQNNVPVIGTVGRLIDAKDYSRLLRAIAILKDKHYKFRVDVVGNGPEMDALKKTTRDLELGDTVQFVGTVTDVDTYYRSFDMFVSSSKREGLPIALLEAMAYGLPIVATDVGASAETVCNGEGGLIVAPNDTTALADALKRLLDDATLRARLGGAARRRVEKHFSVSKLAHDYLSMYRQILGTKCERNPDPTE